MIGRPSTQSKVKAFLDDIAASFDSRHLPHMDGEQLGREAHRVISIVGMLSFLCLSQVCADIDAASKDEKDISTLIDKLAEIAALTITEGREIVVQDELENQC